MADRPSAGSVLFVVLDTVRKDRCSVYGHDRPTTPNLERLAAESAVYEEAIAPAPWTLPVHASMFTGRYPSEHGATQRRPYLEGETTLAETLAAAGYATACHTTNAWISPYTGLTDGFQRREALGETLPFNRLAEPLAEIWRRVIGRDDRWFVDRIVGAGNALYQRLGGGEREESRTAEAIDRTIAFVAGNDPFFAFANLMDAHLPYRPPEGDRERFAPGVDPDGVCQDSKAYNCGARSIDADEWSAIRRLYDAELRSLDRELGRLFDHLRANDEWDETLVIVCADHGELHGEGGLYGHEFALYEPLVNVPLVVNHPDVTPSRRTGQVELLDLYHTVLDHAGIDGVGFDPSRSLLREGEGREYAFVEYDRPQIELRRLEAAAADAGIDLDRDSRFYSRMRAARRPDAKYVRNERIPDECYRLDRDPTESESDPTDPRAESLERALTSFEARVGGWPDEPATGADRFPARSRERLRDLGYLE